IRVLLLTGQGSHDWRSTAPSFRKILDETGRFDVRVCEVLASFTSQALADFDVLIDDRGASATGAERDSQIAEFVKSGKGLVLTRGAPADGTPQLTAAAGPPARTSNESARPDRSEVSNSPRNHSSLSELLDIKIAHSEHPILSGLPAGASIADSRLNGLRLPD